MAEALRSEDDSVGCVGSVLSSSVVSRDPRPSGLQGLHLDPGNQTARYQFLCSLKWKEEKRLSWDFQYFRIRIFKRQIKSTWFNARYIPNANSTRSCDYFDNPSRSQFPGTEALEKLTDIPKWLRMLQGIKFQQEQSICPSTFRGLLCFPRVIVLERVLGKTPKGCETLDLPKMLFST